MRGLEQSEHVEEIRLCEPKVLAAGRHRGIQAVTEILVAFILGKIHL